LREYCLDIIENSDSKLASKAGLNFPKVRKWSGKKGFLRVMEFYFGSGEIGILKNSLKKIWKSNPGDSISLKAGRNSWDHCDFNHTLP